MNKLTNIRLDSKGFLEYTKAVSGLFMALHGESLSSTEVKLIWLIKTGFKTNKEDFISRKLRAQLAHALELKPQTLYNRLADLKRKEVLVKKDKKITLSPVFNDRVNVNITYNYNDKGKVKTTA